MDDSSTATPTTDNPPNSDNPDNPEPMESLESRNSDKIDLSLDDIIKLNRKEQRVNRATSKARNQRASNKHNVLRKLDKTGRQQRFPVRQGQSQQGTYRSKYMGPSPRWFYKVKPFNIKKAAIGAKGVSPLNRHPMNTKATVQFGQHKPLFRGVFYQRNRSLTAAQRRPAPPPREQGNPPFQPKQRRGSARPFVLNRGFSAMQASEKLERFQRARSWRKAPSTGCTVTVSLPNAKAIPEPGTKAKQTMDRSISTGGETYSPKGIPLRYNLKATINQTGVTLNDRFTGMRILSPPGQGPQRGGSRGRGRGRGLGRTVVLQ
ncbi:UAP56-interacting factor [Osmerus eperlanus]|uniref:UAP56-interacting factor n=1 Tax=Osmerus eperlanus TaxID=29151 RepID=UPI002E1568A7